MIQVDENQVKVLAQVAKELYGDALQPAAQQAGRLVALPLRIINAALGGAYLSVFAAEKVIDLMQNYLEHYFEDRLEAVMVPPPNIAVPTMQALVYCGSIPELRDMFLRLLATSMDSEKDGVAHPSYVEILKQITPDEARILGHYEVGWQIDSWQAEVQTHKMKGSIGYFETGPVYKRLTLIAKDVDCHTPTNVPKYVDNLVRLRLIYETRKWGFDLRRKEHINNPPHESEHPDGIKRTVGGERVKEMYEDNPMLAAHLEAFTDQSDHIQMWHSNLRLTAFGVDFFTACLDKVPAPRPAGFAETVLAEEAL